MRTFHQILVNVLITTFTNNFVWFALTFWAYLETKSVLATSIVSGTYLVAGALSGFWFGSIVDHYKKKSAMIISSLATLVLFAAGLFLYASLPEITFTSLRSVSLWLFILVLLLGVISGNIRNIAITTLTTLLVPEDKRDKANGLVGTITGVSFAITSVGSGFALARTGMSGVLLIAIFLTFLAILHLTFISIPEDVITPHTEDKPKKIDVKGTIKVVGSVPGLGALIVFNTLNNLLGGVFMSLMDAYGLNIVSVETWGTIWGFLSLGFIVGGLIVSKKGVGVNPLKSMLYGNFAMWFIAMIFTVNSWIGFLIAGMAIWITLFPFIEAAEQTLLQKVVPFERQGRVFGFAQSVEQSVSPMTAFLIGPIAQFVFIPFMTTGAGVELIGDWFGVGVGRGIALVFTITGIVGVVLSLFAINSRSYKLLSKKYLED